MKQDKFIMGVIIGLFVSVLLFSFTFIVSLITGISRETSLIYSLLVFTISLLMVEMGVLVYYMGFTRGKFSKKERLENLVIELNSIKNAKKDVQKGYFQRGLDKKSRDDILDRLKERELRIKNEIELLKG